MFDTELRTKGFILATSDLTPLHGSQKDQEPRGSSVLKEHIREPQRLGGVQDLTNKNYKVPQKGPPGSFSHELLLHQGLGCSHQSTQTVLMSTIVPPRHFQPYERTGLPLSHQNLFPGW